MNPPLQNPASASASVSVSVSVPAPAPAPAAPRRPAPRQHRPGWLGALAALCLGAASLGAAAQTSQVLKTLVASHGSLAAGDVVFTNFRLPLIPANLVILGDTFVKPRDGADVTVQASVAADGRINLVLTPINPATGLPAPYRVDAKTGAALPTDIINYLEFDVVVTHPQRRLHGFDRAFGPGVKAVMGSTAFNWVSFFDATNANQFSAVANDQVVNGVDYFNTGPVTLTGGDRAGARFAAHWGLNSSDWGGVRIGNASLDSVTLRFSLANAVAPAVPVALGLSSFFADAVYLSTPAPAGGATIALSSSDTSALTVPASVTVPAGAFYSAYRAQKQPVLNATIATVSGMFNANTSTATEWVFIGEAVGAAPLPTLSVTLDGKGKVVSASRTINCGIVCSTTPIAGPLNGWSETLTASAGSGSVFSGWTGACAGTAPTCHVIVNGGVGVGATFTALAPGGGGGGGGAAGFKLSVAKGNSGTVLSTPAGINCGSVCTASYGAGNAVSLTATPPPGLAFLGWSGACSGAATSCTVTMTADTKVQANFSK